MEFGSNSQLPKVNWRLDVFNAAANKLTMMAAKTSPIPGCSSCQARTQSRITNAMIRPPVKIEVITVAGSVDCRQRRWKAISKLPSSSLPVTSLTPIFRLFKELWRELVSLLRSLVN